MSEPLQYACDEHDYQGFVRCPKCPKPSSFVPAPGSEAVPWLVRMVEGMRRDTYAIFVDGSVRPIIKSKNEAELQRVADAHNKLRMAVRWALGEVGDFGPRPEGVGAYWWRTELRRRAGMSPNADLSDRAG